jgi:alkanesulfonate monooxygenase SsuD/methylene tetrahydromethanopterin reductase-like flavin-dependent oxidoreductase (luciferase family)
MTLRLGLSVLAYGDETVELVVQAERLGVDSVWSAEFWAGDAFTPLAFLAARTSTIKLGSGIAQLGARTPAMLAMTAQSLQAWSGGRCLLGIGASGPQVMEGWHGVSFDRPVRRTWETIEVIHQVNAEP